MALTRCALFLTLLVAGGASVATPISKVIDLLQGLKTEVEDEGKAEGTSYEKYACFCKDTSDDKSKSVNTLKDNIDVLSAEIADDTQSRKDDTTELGERKTNQEKLSAELDETNVRCAKDKAAYEEVDADLSKAISSLRSAIKAMKESMPSAASLIAIKSDVVQALSGKSLERTSSIQKAMAALKARVDPSDPTYEYHSNDIVSLCESLLDEFKADKEDSDQEWAKTLKACQATKKSLREEMAANKKAMDALDKEIERLAAKIAKARENLVIAEGDLKDDKQYLEDLGAQCAARAKDYDQRSQMRADELAALTKALGILTDDVEGRANEVNERAAALFLQQRTAPAEKAPAEKAAVVAPAAKAPAAKAPAAKTAAAAPKGSVSFLQEAIVKQHSQGFLSNDASLEARKNRALSALQEQARTINSLTISALVARVRADPFKKVKGLIQKLIERLLEESKNEATKKGFCDTSLATAEADRDARFVEATDLSRELKGLEAKRDELDEEIDELAKNIAKETKQLKETTEDRETEKKENMKTLKTAKEGLEAVTNALAVLKSFYSSAAKAALVQASPVDEDTDGPGFSGNYKGKQGGMKSVFALLEVIQSDFDRTLRKTEESEHNAHRDFVKFSQTSKSDIASMSEKKELDEQDLKATKTKIESKSEDMQANVDMLDSALKELEELKPTCMDSGMSYADRVKKREDEMKALKVAMCILDTDGKEGEC